MIFVSVGSREHPFDRLLKKIDDLIEDKVITEEVFAQIGESNYVPRHYAYRQFISTNEFFDYLEKARLVITHGGTGTIVNALEMHKKVIAVTRLKKYKEHVDDHQVQIVQMFRKRGVLIGIQEMDELADAIHFFDDHQCKPNSFDRSDEPNMIQMIDNFIQENFLSEK